MAKLLYSVISSLDHRIADDTGNFDWAAPDEEVHRFVNDVERPIGTYLYGRRMYEVMAAWDNTNALPDRTPITLDFASIWQAADKIVFSRTLDAPSTARTRIERSFDPDAVRQLKADAVRDITIGGPEIAATAIRAGLVDELHCFLVPIVIGRGKPALPDDARFELDLIDERRFNGGVVFLRYALRGGDAGMSNL
jgi:dihydrofolate reductase